MRFDHWLRVIVGLASIALATILYLARPVATALSTAASTTSQPTAAVSDWLQTCPERSASLTTQGYNASLGLTWPETWRTR